jgi:hypothetical protein
MDRMSCRSLPCLSGITRADEVLRTEAVLPPLRRLREVTTAVALAVAKAALAEGVADPEQTACSRALKAAADISIKAPHVKLDVALAECLDALIFRPREYLTASAGNAAVELPATAAGDSGMGASVNSQVSTAAATGFVVA